jgi:hypothetical protein
MFLHRMQSTATLQGTILLMLKHALRMHDMAFFLWLGAFVFHNLQRTHTETVYSCKDYTFAVMFQYLHTI